MLTCTFYIPHKHKRKSDIKAATHKRAAPVKIILHGVREPTGHRKKIIHNNYLLKYAITTILKVALQLKWDINQKRIRQTTCHLFTHKSH